MADPAIAERTWALVRRLVGLAGVLGFVIGAFTPLANFVDRRLSIPSRLEPADAIIVLAHGIDADSVLTNNSMRRALRGIALYKQGLAPFLVFSGLAGNRAPREAEVRAELAREMGISPAAVLAKGAARTTREEAASLGALLLPMGVRRVLLVTHSEHMWRARRLFERASFEVLPASVADFYDASTPEDRLALTRGIIQELAARLYDRITHGLVARTERAWSRS